MAVRIDMDWCINCHRCRRVCPTDAILYVASSRRTHVVSPEGCLDCDRCIAVCPARCIHYDPAYGGEQANGAAAKRRARQTSAQQALAGRT